MSTEVATTLGVHSEVGTLRTVIVHRPDIAHERLSPTNSHELLFDDVIWVRRARQEHDAFVDLMREAGVEVLLFHDLLAETLEDKKARKWILERRLRPEEVTAVFSEPLTEWARGPPGGRARVDPDRRPDRAGAPRRRPQDDRAGDEADRLRPPARSRTSCSCATRAPGSTAASRSTRCSGRRASTRRSTSSAVYRFHPRFADAGFEIVVRRLRPQLGHRVDRGRRP